MSGDWHEKQKQIVKPFVSKETENKTTKHIRLEIRRKHETLICPFG